MASTATNALSVIAELGTPRFLSTWAPANRVPVNTHIHLPPNFSAFASVEQAVELAGTQGVRVLGASNYYDYGVYNDFADMARRRGVFPLFGLEIITLIDELVKAGVKINDPGNPGKMYICGKGITRFDPMNAESLRLTQLIRQNDSRRMSEVARKLSEVITSRGMRIELDGAAVIDRVASRYGCPRDRVYLQERHVCQTFQEALYERLAPVVRGGELSLLLGAPIKSPNDPVKVQNDIRAHLMKAGKPAYVPETFVSFEQAYQLILELGGIPCYPTLADGTAPICPFEQPIDKLIGNMKDRGIHCAEFVPVRNAPGVLSAYVKAMRAAGIAVTAGTEHNTLDLLPMEPMCAGGQAVPDDVKAIFWEGACVVAAHQFLSLYNECGYVDSAGRPNSTYATADERITEMARIGSRVIGRYFQCFG